MNVTCNAKQLAQALARMAKILPRGKVPQFQNAAWMFAQDGALRLRVIVFDAQATVDIPDAVVREEGSAGVDLRQLSKIAAQFSGEVEICTETVGTMEGNTEQTVAFTSDGFTCRFEPRRMEWYSPEKFEGLLDAVMPVAQLREWLRRITYCVSEEYSMEAMACMLVEAQPGGMVHACGLNGHQFAMMQAELPQLSEILDETWPLLLHMGSLKVLAHWLTGEEVRICVARRSVRFETAAGQLILPSGQWAYPDYLKFCAKAAAGPITVEVNRRALIFALKRVEFFCTLNSRCVHLQMREGALDVSMRASGYLVPTAQTSIAATCAGEHIRVAFPAHDLSEMLGHFTGETVTLTLGGIGKTTEVPGAPCQITGDDADAGYTTIIMPMKIVEATYYAKEAA